MRTLFELVGVIKAPQDRIMEAYRGQLGYQLATPNTQHGNLTWPACVCLILYLFE